MDEDDELNKSSFLGLTSSAPTSRLPLVENLTSNEDIVETTCRTCHVTTREATGIEYVAAEIKILQQVPLDSRGSEAATELEPRAIHQSPHHTLLRR